jgi:hypothetical protein
MELWSIHRLTTVRLPLCSTIATPRVEFGASPSTVLLGRSIVASLSRLEMVPLVSSRTWSQIDDTQGTWRTVCYAKTTSLDRLVLVFLFSQIHSTFHRRSLPSLKVGIVTFPSNKFSSFGLVLINRPHASSNAVYSKLLRPMI